jgi:hypothetical protein
MASSGNKLKKKEEKGVAMAGIDLTVLYFHYYGRRMVQYRYRSRA